MNTKQICAAMALVVAAGAAPAAFMDGNTLLGRMKDPAKRVLAVGYVMGVTDALNPIVICPPGNVTAGQLTDMVQGFLEATPVVRHQAADAVVTAVLKEAFPCAPEPKPNTRQF